MISSPPIAGLTASAAAAIFGAAFDDLLSPARGRRPVARARQFAVYLHHVALGASLSDCARSFARDRATVRHACARIEDMRDDAAFDLATTRLEAALVAHRDMVLGLLDHAATGRNRPVTENVIDSKSEERARREKPVPAFSPRALERFQAKWEPVRVKKTRHNLAGGAA